MKDLGSIDAKRAAELGRRADMDLEPCERADFVPATKPKLPVNRDHLWKKPDAANTD